MITDTTGKQLSRFDVKWYVKLTYQLVCQLSCQCYQYIHICFFGTRKIFDFVCLNATSVSLLLPTIKPLIWSQQPRGRNKIS